MVKKSILTEAEELTNKDRPSSYGHPLDDFSRTAKIWSGILTEKLKQDITPEEVGLMMVGLKMSRECNKHKRDNLVDMAGYVNTIDKVITERNRRTGDG